MIKIKIFRSKEAISNNLPKYQTRDAAGIDLTAAFKEKEIIIKPNERALIPTGIYLSLPKNIEGQVRPRSGLALKFGLTVLNSPGTIDPDYKGEIKVILINHGSDNQIIENGMRVAQLVFSPIVKIKLVEVNELDISERGEKGFGSTGIGKQDEPR
tara:strand:+ start:28 stop:495 length:468 start_codon:yes stop_codon:yes gene_type:complete